MDRAIGKTWPGVLTSVLSCLLVYLWGVLGFSFLWVVIAWAGYIEHITRRATRAREREQALALVAEGEEAFLKVSTKTQWIRTRIPDVKYIQSRIELPAWVQFPETERAEWLNSLVAEVWPRLGALAMRIMQDQVEPMVAEMLRDNLRNISGFR